ncbi:carboxypeptidase-like regulatory domain-containing protein [Pedobacter heparinus]|uniref:carboxypeptidase-like regulatory domain-containing protein n=1 Tax=Pedobacter heparinus TaxID=984 RepID=UPI00292CC9B4|nr:carboxypeptidase-like regulatory domain-containing protein [Pedobacter heparinus]
MAYLRLVQEPRHLAGILSFFGLSIKKIKLKTPSLLDKAISVIQRIAKDLTVKGRVVDETGKPLPNANIRVKGKNAVTNTNQNGEFSIPDVPEDAVLLIRYVGYKELEIPLKEPRSVLSPDGNCNRRCPRLPYRF